MYAFVKVNSQNVLLHVEITENAIAVTVTSLTVNQGTGTNPSLNEMMNLITKIYVNEYLVNFSSCINCFYWLF